MTLVKRLKQRQMIKNLLLRRNPKCHQSPVSDNRSCSRVLKTPLTISVVIDWHVSSWATINSCREREKRNLSCGDLACLFYGLIFVGHDAEGTLQRKAFLTICQGRLSGDTCYWNGDIFNSFKDSSGHLLCHWKWSLASVRVNCLADPSMTGCDMAHKRVLDVITWTVQWSQWGAECTFH